MRGMPFTPGPEQSGRGPRGRRGHHHHGGGFEGRRPQAEDDFGHQPFGPPAFGPGGPGGPGRRGGPFGGPFGSEFAGRGMGRARRGGPGGRGRARRGDVRIALLLLLAEQPMHGYQLMEAMAERTAGTWRPSPGAVYPTIAQLEDEGLVQTEADGGRKLVTLTEAGRTLVEQQRESWGDPFAELAGDEPGPDLRSPVAELLGAVRQVSVSGSKEQVEQAAAVLAQAKRSLYLILAGEQPTAPSE